MYRVLKPEGHVMILELSSPEQFPMKQLFAIIQNLLSPMLGNGYLKKKRLTIICPPPSKSFHKDWK
jgi:demethylmenaquinone methyltransferase/2-methoxy-6-polyprenyl-1,4-benzoquinol methylase